MLFYREFGNKEGKLLVFIHGGFTTSESYMKQFGLFEEFHCIFVDLPKHGNSDKKGIVSCRRAADEVIELVDAISPKEKVVLIAHSYGGLTAKLILAKIPQRIEKCVIGSTNIKKTPLFWIYTRKAGCIFLWLQNKERYKKDHISWKLVCETQKDAWRNFRLTDLDRYKDVPILFLFAQHDIKEIKESMVLWKRQMHSAGIVEIKNAGHNYFWEFPDVVNPIIRSFVKGENNVYEKFDSVK